MTSPSKLKHSYTVSEEEEEDIIETPTKPNHNSRAQTEPPPSISNRRLPQPPIQTNTTIRSTSLSQNDNLAKISPQLLHSLRESFSVLDSNSNGYINAESVTETLQSLGLQEDNMKQFFPLGQSQVSLPQYLTQLANLLVGLSPQQELLNAFSAFDDDDSGQIDVTELRSALINTVPEAGDRALTEREIDRAIEGFTGRRILGRGAIGIPGVRGLNTPAGKKGGDVFRYQEFVGNLTGSSAIGQQEANLVVR